MRLQETGAKALPVVHAGQLVGLITTKNITEFLMIRSALKAANTMSRSNGVRESISGYESLFQNNALNSFFVQCDWIPFETVRLQGLVHRFRKILFSLIP